MSVFPNAKAQLLGAPEDSIAIIDTPAVADLAGSLVVEDVNIQLGSTFDSGELSGLQTLTTGTLLSVTVTPVNATNKVKIIARIDVGSFDDGATVEIREGSTVLVDQLVTGGITAAIRTLTVDLTDVSVAAHTYTLRIRFISGIGFQYGNGGSTDTSPDVIAPDLVAALTDFLDTHAGIITTPATAIKQINSADSHATQESGVIA